MSKEVKKFEPGSKDLFKENIEKLKELFPQVVSDGEIDFEMLKTILYKDLAESVEKYQFTWNGKARTIKLAQTPSNGTLLPSKKDSKNWDTTENLYIEGDNLEVLKLLQKTYFNKIKMIYIDPPYNTGGDFVYKDDFKDSIKNYKEQTNQTTRTNPETSGRYHTDWLNMMYSRLMLAKNLLSDDGVIFVSIDDNEVENLKKIMNEIFGENNFITTFLWKKTENIKMDSKFVSINKDYSLCYKMPGLGNFNKILSGTDRYSLSDEKGSYYLRRLDGKNGYSKSLDYVIEHNGKQYYAGVSKDKWLKRQNGNNVSKDPRWLWSKSKTLEGIKDNDIIFKDDKVYNKVRYDGVPKKPYIDFLSIVSGQTSQKDLNKLFNDNRIFDHPKPIQMITTFCRMVEKENPYIILDFFSGSATTAHAVMQLNAEDGGNRKFIMVQLPEKTQEDSEAYKAGYKNICEIGKERIRRAGELVKKDLIEKNSKLDKDQEKVDPNKLDIGFKVFKLDESNFKEWDSSKEPTIEQLELFADPFKEGKSEEEVLYEVLLKYGVFDQEVKKFKINNKDIYSISENYLIVMLSSKITPEDVEEIKKLKPKIVIFRDSGFNGNDTIKINAFYTLTKSGVEEVKTV
jgi:adenine-specific DNA-methyltransferase